MDPTRRLKQVILEAMRRPDWKPASLVEIRERLHIGKAQKGAFRRALRDLLSEEAVVRVDRKRYAAAGHGLQARAAPGRTNLAPGRPDQAPLLNGVLQVNPRGFGFVVPDGGGRDVFIPPPGIGDRRDGDRVAVRIVRQQSDGRLQGEIARVLERTGRRVVGVYRTAGLSSGPLTSAPEGGGVVEAYDRRYEGGIVIPVGERDGAVNGLVVGVEIVHAAEDGRRAVGRVVEVLGPKEAPETDLLAVIRKYGLRDLFPADVVEQAGGVADVVRSEDCTGREDFRGLPVITIDGETAMDFDDAVHVRRNPDHTYELQVHIADVARYVRPSTPLDREALERATSVYFPGTSLPMLPHRLSNGICSLNPGVDRLVQSCLMTIDRDGLVRSYRLCEGVIRSAARMTYTHVARILSGGDPALAEHYRDLVPGFHLMEELCGVLNERRRRRGSIDFDLPEPEVILAATGEMTGVLALEHNVAHRIIEEFMLAANETVARHLWKARVPSLYRVHERPDPRRLEEFDAVAQAFGYVLPRPFTSIEPGAFQAILDRAKGRPEERFLARLMLRSMKQARYSEKRDIHFGLASSCYTHFTSPIRRYPDLVVHRLVKRLLRGGPPGAKERGDLEAFLPETAARSSFRERTADQAENELIERKKMAFMAERLGEEFDGIVSGVEPFGLFVELRDYFIQGLVPIESLPDDRYRYDERRMILLGERRGRTFALGDAARVRVDRVNQFRLEIELSLIGSRPGPRMTGSLPRPPATTRARPAGRRRAGARPRRRR